MDQWSHMDFENLIQGVLSGEYNIQEPLIIHNVAGDRVNKQSFLNYLMNYENINKDNFLRALHDIFNTLQKRIYKLKSNPNINRMIIRIHDEWIEPEKDFVLIKSISPEIIDVKHVIDKEYGKSCEFCDNAEKTCQVLRSSPIDEINKSNNVDRETEWAIMLCDELSNKIQSTMEDVKNYINQTKSYDLSLLIDLSIKHKSLYLKLNDVQDDEIPENIHTIFSNYIYMFNLFHKQLPELSDLPSMVIFPAFIENINYTDDEKKYDLCTIARLEYRKGHHLVLEALTKLKKEKNLILTYAILGDGPELSKLKDLVVKNNLLHQVDFINNKNSSDVYKQSKIHVMPTITTPDSIEGFGISNVEAASFGLPSIVSSSGGTPESIDQNGYVINENDINELSNKISLTLENYSELSKKSLLFAKNFEKNIKIKEYLNCFND